MGLCKCRNVTNLFCFEHRRNVCESCLLSDHAKCIVKSYLQWLQNSDFDSKCYFCKEPFAAGAHGDTIRLTCLDLFHERCLLAYCATQAAALGPSHVACPQCKTPVLPSSRAHGRVAAQLQSRAAQWDWTTAAAPAAGGADTVLTLAPASTAAATPAPHSPPKATPASDSSSGQWWRQDRLAPNDFAPKTLSRRSSAFASVRGSGGRLTTGNLLRGLASNRKIRKYVFLLLFVLVCTVLFLQIPLSVVPVPFSERDAPLGASGGAAADSGLARDSGGPPAAGDAGTTNAGNAEPKAAAAQPAAFDRP